MDTIFKKGNSRVKDITTHLIALKGHQCECCGNTEWQGKPITLHTHHIDGDNTNNELCNLMLLCPNCHSQTDNFGSKNIKKPATSEEDFIIALQNNTSIRQALLSLGLSDASGNYVRAKKLIEQYQIVMPNKITTKMKNYCPICGKQIDKSAKYCKKCDQILSRTVERPNREELKFLIRNESFVSIGKRYNVTDNAIRKWCIVEHLPYKKTDIKKYTDEDWDKI